MEVGGWVDGRWATFSRDVKPHKSTEFFLVN